MDIEETYRITVDGFEDLVIEKIGDDRLSVGQYYTQCGDLMSDPEVVFRIDGDRLVPVRYTHHPYSHEYDPAGLTNVADFLETWDKNLRRQGFVTAAAGGEV